MNLTRYDYKIVPISAQEAKELRRREIEDALNEIQYLKEEIKKLEDYLAFMATKPLVTTITKQIVLNPGDPGYDEAPPLFIPNNYQGEMSWINTQSKDEM